MTNLLSRLKDVLFTPGASFPQELPNLCKKTRKGMLKELQACKRSGNPIGVCSPAFGGGLFTAAVEDIRHEGKEEVVVFQRYDKEGHMLHRVRIPISNIHMICPIRTEQTNVLAGETVLTSLT
jgi:hypothetical protein